MNEYLDMLLIDELKRSRFRIPLFLTGLVAHPPNVLDVLADHSEDIEAIILDL